MANSKVERMFGPRESWGKDDERERVEAGKAVGKNRKKPASGRKAAKGKQEIATSPAAPRNDMALEAGVTTGAQAKKAGFNKGLQKQQIKPIGGFVSIRCGGCGKVVNTCLREKRTIFNCKSCGRPTPLERLVSIHMLCPRCGFKGNYRSNRVEKELVMECLECSQPVAMKRIRGGSYVPVEEIMV